MRRTTAFVAAALVFAGILVGTGAGAAGLHAPQVRVTVNRPMTVVGTGFKHRERVVVTVRSTPGGRSLVHRMTTTAAGGFTTSFPRFRMGGCGSMLSIVATGSKGSRATLAQKLINKLECAT